MVPVVSVSSNTSSRTYISSRKGRHLSNERVAEQRRSGTANGDLQRQRDSDRAHRASHGRRTFHKATESSLALCQRIERHCSWPLAFAPASCTTPTPTPRSSSLPPVFQLNLYDPSSTKSTCFLKLVNFGVHSSKVNNK